MSRWETVSDIVTCQTCWGSGDDQDELDGHCFRCRGKGEVEYEQDFCNWCGCEAVDCECDEVKSNKPQV